MPLVALRTFGQGLRASATTFAARALAWTYGAVLATSTLFFFPFFVYVRSTVAGSSMALELRSGQIPDWIVDLGGSAGTGQAIVTFMVIALVLVPVYLLLVIALTGGVLESVASALGLRTADRSFLAACGDLVGPMARIALIEVPTVGLILFALGLARLGIALTTSSPFLAWGWLVATVIVVGFVTSIFDLARVRLYLIGDRSALHSLGDACRFTFSKFPSVFVLSLLNACVASVVLVESVRIHSFVSLDTTGGVLVGIVVGQLSILARLWSRLVAYGSEMALWSSFEGNGGKNLD